MQCVMRGVISVKAPGLPQKPSPLCVVFVGGLVSPAQEVPVKNQIHAPLDSAAFIICSVP